MIVVPLLRWVQVLALHWLGIDEFRCAWRYYPVEKLTKRRIDDGKGSRLAVHHAGRRGRGPGRSRRVRPRWLGLQVRSRARGRQVQARRGDGERGPAARAGDIRSVRQGLAIEVGSLRR